MKTKNALLLPTIEINHFKYKKTLSNVEEPFSKLYV